MRTVLFSVKRYLPVFCCLLFIATIFVTLPPAHAEEVSFWTSSQDPSLEIENDSYEVPPNAGKNCSYQDYSLSKWHKSGSFGGYYADVVLNECTTQTAYGAVSEDATLKFKNDSQAYKVHSLGIPVSVPNASSYIYTTRSGFHAVDRPVSQFEYGPGVRVGSQGVLYEYEYHLKQGAAVRSLRDSRNGGLIDVDNIKASADGEWLVVQFGSGKMARIDPDTFNILLFPGGIPRYSSNAQLNASLAVSNDGRYAAIAGGFSDGGHELNVYDLSTCERPDPSYNLSIAENCGAKKLAGYMKAQLPGFLTAQHLQFSSDGSQLSITAVGREKSEELFTKRVTLTAPGQDYSGLEYLALGDSFSSGEGDTELSNVVSDDEKHQLTKFYIPGTDVEEDAEKNIPREKCHISSRSYPYLMAQEWGVLEDQFASVACSGARISDIIGGGEYLGQDKRLNPEDLSQNKINELQKQALVDSVPGRIRQIEFIKKYKPKAITLSIAGNDADFGIIIGACAPNVLVTCKYADDDVEKNRLGVKIKQQFKKLNNLFEAIHLASPNTRIYVMGYPQFVNHTNNVCRPNVLLDKEEREMAYEGVKYINQVIEASARASGVKYLKVENSIREQLCDSLTETAHITGAAFRPPSEKQESYHPNNLGHYDMRLGIEGSLSHESALTYDNCPDIEKILCSEDVSVPDIPDWFEPGAIEESEEDPKRSYVSVPLLDNGEILTEEAFQISLDYLQPGSIAEAKLLSNPIDLGRFTVDSNGQINEELILPAGTPSGYHELHVYATAPSGEKIDFHQIILVKASADDIDGDGISNTEDQCNFVEPVGVDEDKDGIDDACDPLIDEPPVPEAPAVNVPDIINASDQTNVAVSGSGEVDTTAHIAIDDNNPDTMPVEASTELEGADYTAALDVNSLDDGVIKVSVYLSNKYGQSESTTAETFKDTKLPETDAAVNPAPNDAGWHKKDVTVHFNATDEGSGLEYFSYSANGAQPIEMTVADSFSVSVPITEEGETKLTYFATDKAGNEEEKNELTIRLDRTSPSASIRKPRPPVLLSLFSSELTIFADDNLSGAAKVEATFISIAKGTSVTLPAVCDVPCNTRNSSWQLKPAGVLTGPYTVTASSVDTAGNRSQASAPVRVIVVNIPQLSRWW